MEGRWLERSSRTDLSNSTTVSHLHEATRKILNKEWEGSETTIWSCFFATVSASIFAGYEVILLLLPLLGWPSLVYSSTEFLCKFSWPLGTNRSGGNKQRRVVGKRINERQRFVSILLLYRRLETGPLQEEYTLYIVEGTQSSRNSNKCLKTCGRVVVQWWTCDGVRDKSLRLS